MCTMGKGLLLARGKPISLTAAVLLANGSLGKKSMEFKSEYRVIKPRPGS